MEINPPHRGKHALDEKVMEEYVDWDLGFGQVQSDTRWSKRLNYSCRGKSSLIIYSKMPFAHVEPKNRPKVLMYRFTHICKDCIY